MDCISTQIAVPLTLHVRYKSEIDVGKQLIKGHDVVIINSDVYAAVISGHDLAV